MLNVDFFMKGGIINRLKVYAYSKIKLLEFTYLNSRGFFNKNKKIFIKVQGFCF